MNLRPHNKALWLGLVTYAFCTTTASATEILIPSYFYPSGAGNPWNQLNQAAGQVAITAILNPNSGPGNAVDTNYRNAANALRASGGRVICYVSTSYANRPLATVKADIDKFEAFYGVLDGFFLDEMTSDNAPASIAYYTDIRNYIKTKNAAYSIVGNPGTNTTQTYISSGLADTIITFENISGYDSFVPSSWAASYARRRFSNIPYSIASSTAMINYISAAASKRVGYMYVTDDGADGNPWNSLPAYWSQELAAVRAVTPTWGVAISGNFLTSSNWTTGVAPNGVDAEAYLLGEISQPQTAYTNAPVTLGTLVFGSAHRYDLNGAGSLTMDTTVDAPVIDVRRGSHTINVPLFLNKSTTALVAADSTLTIADPLVLRSGAVLTKIGAGTLTIASTVSEEVALSVLGGTLAVREDLSISSLELSVGATLDIGAATVRVRSADVNMIRTKLRNALANGMWEGPGVLSTSVNTHVGIGYEIEGDTLILKATLFGDANIDGNVNFDDLLTMARQARNLPSWSSGDVDYDGVFTSADLALIQSNYDGDLRSDFTLAYAMVPEPAVLLGLLVPALQRRRRSRV